MHERSLLNIAHSSRLACWRTQKNKSTQCLLALAAYLYKQLQELSALACMRYEDLTM